MTTSPNVETTKNGYAAFSAGDLEKALADFHDDVKWIVPGNSAVGGTYHGKAEAMDMFAKLAEKSFTVTPSRFFADEDVVIVLSQVTAGGESASQADAYIFRDGKIVEVWSYVDTAMQERVFGTK